MEGEGKEHEKLAQIKELAERYYSRKEIQKAIFEFSQGREVVPKYFEQFGKRPDTLQYPSDVSALAEKGATSFHCSEERWKNPLELNTDLSREQLDSLRVGWDLIIDIDGEYLDYSKVAAELVIKALHFHGIKNLGLKYSGNKGFHILVPFEAFPKELNEIEIKDIFPDGARAVLLYINELISKEMQERISEISKKEEKAKVLDIVLVSPRHLFRAPYSLHEKTGLASIVIKPEQIKQFHPGWASPHRVFPKSFLPKAEPNEAKELLREALDWSKSLPKEKRQFSSARTEIVSKDVSAEIFPHCIRLALQGMRADGRKRALFLLLNFLNSMNFNYEEVKEKIEAWNKLNYKPLKQGYVSTQISWHSKHKVLPPNCDKPNYEDIGLCQPDFLCGNKKIKNPVNYVVAKLKRQQGQTQKQEEQKKQRLPKRKSEKKESNRESRPMKFRQYYKISGTKLTKEF